MSFRVLYRRGGSASANVARSLSKLSEPVALRRQQIRGYSFFTSSTTVSGLNTTSSKSSYMAFLTVTGIAAGFAAGGLAISMVGTPTWAYMLAG